MRVSHPNFSSEKPAHLWKYLVNRSAADSASALLGHHFRRNYDLKCLRLMSDRIGGSNR